MLNSMCAIITLVGAGLTNKVKWTEKDVHEEVRRD